MKEGSTSKFFADYSLLGSCMHELADISWSLIKDDCGYKLSFHSVYAVSYNAFGYYIVSTWLF